MAYAINAAECAGCGACESECPNGAIRMRGDVYAITAGKCTECKGVSPIALCVQACVSDCISLA